MHLQDFIKHARDNHSFMGGVDRGGKRVKATGECFTPTPLVQEILDKIPLEQFQDKTKTFLDPTCGDGQFLSEVIIKKMENGSTHEQALMTTYGADLMLDNCIECIKRIYAVTEDEIKTIKGTKIPKQWKRDGVKAIFKVNDQITNIVCADGLKYDFSFGEPEVFGNGLFEVE
jgi:hypothetical protein